MSDYMFDVNLSSESISNDFPELKRLLTEAVERVAYDFEKSTGQKTEASVFDAH